MRARRRLYHHRRSRQVLLLVILVARLDIRSISARLDQGAMVELAPSMRLRPQAQQKAALAVAVVVMYRTFALNHSVLFVILMATPKLNVLSFNAKFTPLYPLILLLFRLW